VIEPSWPLMTTRGVKYVLSTYISGLNAGYSPSLVGVLGT
jgi:hypothetical protein